MHYLCTNWSHSAFFFQMKWNFKDLTNGRTLNVEIKEEIKDGIMPCYVVSLRDQENEAIDIADEICNGGKISLFVFC